MARRVGLRTLPRGEATIWETVTKGSGIFLPRKTGPYTVQSIMGSTITIDKEGVAIHVSLDGVTRTLRVLKGTEPTAGLHDTVDQSQLCTQRGKEKYNFPLTDGSHPGSSKNAIEKIVGQRGTDSQAEQDVQWYGYSAEKNNSEPALELQTNFIRRH